MLDSVTFWYRVRSTIFNFLHMFIYTFMMEKYIILNDILISASELFLKYSYNFANFSFDILIKYILIKRKGNLV